MNKYRLHLVKKDQGNFFEEFEAESSEKANNIAKSIVKKDYSNLKEDDWNLELFYEYETLGYSYSIENTNDEKLYSLNESISNEKFIKNNFKNVSFELVNDGGSVDLKVNYETINGKKGIKSFSSYVDESAIYLYPDYIKAYCGEDKFLKIQEELENQGGEFHSDFLKKYEPSLFKQLSQGYLLDCSPDVVERGAEFTDQDREFFKELL